jgi:hypothetical protein
MGARDSFPGGKAAGEWSWPLTTIYCQGQEKSPWYPLGPQVKVNVKLSLGLTMYNAMRMYPVLNQPPRHEDVWWSGGIPPRINPGARWEWVPSPTRRPLHPEERAPGIHLIGEWMNHRAGLYAVAKRKIPSPAGNRTTVVQPLVSVAILSYPSLFKESGSAFALRQLKIRQWVIFIRVSYKMEFIRIL